ncbi:hypothetical protein BGZ92_003983 [Podila epicladia]|nr:hypothetical protein BGZ92_003983 [Podila epicladia]
MIASVIHWQRKWLLQAQSPAVPEVSMARALLAAFGLELVDPIASPLLQDALKGTSPTTLDYGQFLATHMHRSVDIEQILRPSQFYEPAESDFPLFDIHGARVDSISPTYDENEREMLRLLDLRTTAYRRDGMDKRYLWEVTSKRLAYLFIPCYPESITIIDLHACETNPYFHLASKLSALDTIKLRREKAEAIPKQHLQNLVTFIHMNQAAFPRKKPLHLNFDGSWQYSPVLAQKYRLQHSTKRPIIESAYQKSRITLYEAVGNPISINATPCPKFYGACKNISVNSLEYFYDLRQRHAFSQQAFLQQCHRLKSLTISVHYPDMFSWAVNRLWDGTVERSEHLLHNLQDVDVQLRASFSVLNDVMAAFGETLLHVKVQCGLLEVSSQLDDVIYDVRFSRHCKVGEWNLPFIRTIHIECNVRFGVYVGDFSGSPSLTSLKMRLNGEPIANQVYLAPVWSLPQLKVLELELAAAMLFNYDSLDHMPSLENLVLSSGRYWKPPVKIPRLSSYFTPEGSIGEIATTSEDMSQSWKDQWHMPKLKSLILVGMPSVVFCFNWLKGCPSLEVLDINATQTLRRGSLWSTSSSVANMPSCLSTMDRLSNSRGVEGIDDLGFDHGMAPLLESKLYSIKFSGRWILTETALTRILGLYAPNLTKLSVLKSHYGLAESNEWSWRGDPIVRAAFNSSSLRYLDSHYKVSEGIKSQLGLVKIAWSEMQKNKDAGKKIFGVQGLHYVCIPGESI